MKIFFLSIISLVLFLSFAGCEERSSVSEADKRNSGKILVAYFSMPESGGIDALAGASRVVENETVLGNTQWVAERIAERTGGTLFAIETVQNYPGDHEALVEQGTFEKNNNVRPELKNHPGNLDEYDVLFIGYPIWWADLPMPLYSFLEEYDFSGKKIIPFSSHGGSRLSGTVETLMKELPDSDVIENPFSVSRNSILGSEADIIEWLHNLGF